jgi:hypothetical protein
MTRPDGQVVAADAAGRYGCGEASPAEIRSGYWFWGVVIVGILLVELAGALGHFLQKHVGVTVPWTTISGMVGHLEELWPAAAVFVVAIIAPAAFYALAPAQASRAPRSRLGRRYVASPPAEDPLPWYRAWVVFVLSALVAVLAVSVFDDDFVRAYLIYGSLFFFGIVVPSFLVVVLGREVGFTSLFCTISQLRQSGDWKARLATVALTAGLAVLAIHLAFYPWPDITKEPVNYAGLSATDARSRAVEAVATERNGPARLVYSTQARGVVNGHEAWVVYFNSLDGSDSGCVIVVTSKVLDPTRECAGS